MYHLFAKHGYATETLICLKFGVDPLVKTISDHPYIPSGNALHVAAHFGKANVAQMLLEVVGLDVDIKDRKGNTAAHYAAAKGHLPVLRALNNMNASFIVKNTRNEIPIHTAA